MTTIVLSPPFIVSNRFSCLLSRMPTSRLILLLLVGLERGEKVADFLKNVFFFLPAAPFLILLQTDLYTANGDEADADERRKR